MSMESLMLLENPYGYLPQRKRRKHNPMAKIAVSKWTQGVDVMDAVAALAGMGLSFYVPPLVVKTTDTTGKILNLGVGILTAVATGYVARMALGEGAGKAAIIGGFAGAGAQALNSFGIYKVPGVGRAIGRGPIGNANLVSPPTARQDETVSVIQP